MTTQEIQRLLATRPFEPFRVLVADGRAFDVRHPENLALGGRGRLIAIGLQDSFVTLDLLLVTGIQRPIPRRQGRMRRSA
ncbi:MAG TPA: hypothetical protein VH475_00745 [Tepidisphaeraceae bacterium]|jgi:hypothetical protein